MSDASVVHDTVTLEREIAAPPGRVFALWADAEARRAWGAPFEGVTLEHEEARFAAGGRDVSVCMAGGETVARVTTHYHTIVPDARIVLSEAIESEGEVRGASLVTVEIGARGRDAALRVTIQTVALDGSGLEREAVAGWGTALDALTDRAAAPG